MQITGGLVNLTLGSSLVQGNSAVDWSQVTVNSLFIHGGRVFTINAVDVPLKRVWISPGWTEPSADDQTYVIVRDFTSNLNLPLLNPGDLEAAAIFSRAMRILDSIGSNSGDPAVVDIVITQNAHGFIVGNALRLTTGGAFVLADSSTGANSLVVGVVNNVINANSFWLRSFGRIGAISGQPITGLGTLTSGNLYYLRAAPIVGGGGYVNLCTGDLADTGDLQVPILQADSGISGHLLTFASAVTSVFGPGKPGLVPNPGGSPTGAQILTDVGWALAGLVNNSIEAKHLKYIELTEPATSIEWAAFENRSNNTPVHGFIMDLQTRLKSTEALAGSGGTRTIITRRTHTDGVWEWNIPAGVKVVRVTIVNGDTYTSSYPTGSSRTSAAVYAYRPTYFFKFLLGVEGATKLHGTIPDPLAANTVLSCTPVVKVDAYLVAPYLEIEGANKWQRTGENLITLTLPLSAPFTYQQASEILTVHRVNLVSLHYPENTDFAALGSLNLPHLKKSGLLPARFSGAVIIETGATVL